MDKTRTDRNADAAGPCRPHPRESDPRRCRRADRADPRRRIGVAVAQRPPRAFKAAEHLRVAALADWRIHHPANAAGAQAVGRSTQDDSTGRPVKQAGADTKPNFLDEPTIRPGGPDSFATNAAIDIGEATGAAPVVSGYLIIRESRDESLVGRTITLSKSPFYIGRSGPRNNDLNIDGDKNLSRAHCELIYDRNTWYVIDSGSQLGTTVNDGANITGRVPLSEGDVIKLGGTTVIAFTRRG